MLDLGLQIPYLFTSRYRQFAVIANQYEQRSSSDRRREKSSRLRFTLTTLFAQRTQEIAYVRLSRAFSSVGLCYCGVFIGALCYETVSVTNPYFLIGFYQNQCFCWRDFFIVHIDKVELGRSISHKCARLATLALMKLGWRPTGEVKASCHCIIDYFHIIFDPLNHINDVVFMDRQFQSLVIEQLSHNNQ